MGERIQGLRVKAGLSQEVLAERLGVTRQSVSKWELGQAVPDVDKLVQLARLFGVTTDWLLLYEGAMMAGRKNAAMRFGMYLIVKDFPRAVDFYEKLLEMNASMRGANRFAQFFFDGICLSIMNEAHLPGHDYRGCGDHKFAFNFWVSDLRQTHERVRALQIGTVTEIISMHTKYHYFNLTDPDGNVIEMTGNYASSEA